MSKKSKAVRARKTDKTGGDAAKGQVPAESDPADRPNPGGGARGKGKSDAKGKGQKAAKPKRVSALDAAAQVLAKSEVPLRAKELIAAMEKSGLWHSPSGKTPHATLYAAMIREIAALGDKARFKKLERGVFVATVHATTTTTKASTLAKPDPFPFG